MTHDTESALTHRSNSLLSLRIPREMTVPGVCRGALTQWPQLQAALRELNLDSAFRLTFANSHGSSQAQLFGSPAQLQAALAIDPGYLLRPTPPTDLYAWFVWITLRVYQGARTFNLTLQHLPDLFKATSGATSADCGEWVREVLAGPAGLIARARDISDQAGTFARHLHSIDGDLTAAQSEHALAVQSLAHPCATADSQPTREHAVAMNAYSQAQLTAHESQHPITHLKLTAANVTVLSVVDNMTKAIDMLTKSWQGMAAQSEAIAARQASDLGNMDFLRNELHLDMATIEWAEFACVIQTFIPGTLTIPRPLR